MKKHNFKTDMSTTQKCSSKEFSWYICFCIQTEYRHLQKYPPELFHKKGALKNFAKFTGKHLCQSLSFYKIADLRPATLLKKSLWYRCFLVNSEKF